ncbi:MAG: T9SS type A sorting domain-containing protein [Bacteroidetes bacterium]|nr:T9SS type A sorting domain-containing protein [Bacteroidota bacterium]
MKRNLLYVVVTSPLLLCSILVSNAQTLSPNVIATNGGYAVGGGNSLSWTLGETFNTTLTSSNLILTQGEQQPELASFPLPVTLVYFHAEKNIENTTININWQTASEINSDYFLVERSTDAINFKTIGKVNAAGNSNQLISYSFIDNNPARSTNYYRLNQFDFNGTHEYSPTIKVPLSNTIVGAIIYPNPFNSSINIAVENISQISNCEFRMYNVLGAEVINTILVKPFTTVETNNLPSGIYFYKVIGNNTIIQSGKLISKK